MPKFGVYFREDIKEGVFADSSGNPITTTFDRADSWARERAEEYAPQHDVIFGVAEVHVTGKRWEIVRIIKKYKNISGEVRTV